MAIVDINQAVAEAQQMIETGESRHTILTHLVGAAEIVAGGNSVCSILVLDEHGLLRSGASPHLPEDYLTAIDKLKPRADMGTCAAAAATGSIIFTPDFQADDKWSELKHLPMALGFVGAWSMPIKNNAGKVLGTFGTYFREKRHPSADEIQAKQQLVQLAARVLN